MITITDNAIAKIKDIISEENNPNIKLRISVQGGGCSGMSYGFALDEQINDDDFTYEFNGATIIVDSMSSQYLLDAVVDYSDDLMGQSFVINNPNAETTCGCGSSFSVSSDFYNNSNFSY